MGAFGFFNDHFQEIIGLFQFVVEGKVILGQFKLLQMAPLRHLFPKNIEGRKEPAPAGLFLGSNALRLHFDGKGSLQQGPFRNIIGQVHHRCLGQGRMKNLCLFITFIGFTELCKQFLRNSFHK